MGPGIVSSVLTAPCRGLARALPWLALLALVSGLANAVLVFVVGATLEPTITAPPVVGGRWPVVFVLAAVLYLMTRRRVERHLVERVTEALHQLRCDLLRRLLATPVVRLEGLDQGTVFTTVCDDTRTLGAAAGLVVTLLTSTVTLLAIALYLVAVDPLPALVMAGVVATIAVVYARRTQRARCTFESARQSWSGFVDKVREALGGMKELALDGRQRRAFRAAADARSERTARDTVTAFGDHVDAFLWGETLLLTALALLVFAPWRMLGSTAGEPVVVRARFLVVLLYAIGPMKAILGALPTLARAQVAWRRIETLPLAAPTDGEGTAPNPAAEGAVTRHGGRLEVRGLTFRYPGADGLRVGPIDLRVSAGECLFLTGGNGSGKTTLAKMITGLYPCEAGEIRLDGRLLSPADDGVFAAVFNPCFLFDQLYGLAVADPRLASELERVGLGEEGAEGWPDPRRLSTGQRQRAALLEARLRDRPVLLLDEVAADQDPEYRRRFYEEGLPTLREEGRIVLVISHDEQYFHCADHLVRLDRGRLDRSLRVFENGLGGEGLLASAGRLGDDGAMRTEIS